MIPVISFVGYSNTGKTTLIVKIINEIKQRGYKVGIVKHDAHDFEIDHIGKDTWRHTQAGADIVCISSPRKLVNIRRVIDEMPLETIVKEMKDVDIIFTEGFKRENKPQIEVYRMESGKEPLGKRENLLAVVSDIKLYEGIKHFNFDEDLKVCDFLLQHFDLRGRRNSF